MSTMTLREFAGAVNRCTQVLVPVVFADHDDAIVYLAVPKNEAKDVICKEAKKLGLETVFAELDEEDNCLYVDFPDDEEPGEQEPGDEPEPEEPS